MQKNNSENTVEGGIQRHGLSVKQFKTLAEQMYTSGIGFNQTLMLHGPPGVGKTDAVKELAEDLFHRVFPNIKEVRKTVHKMQAEPEVVSFEGDGENNKFSCIIISAPLMEPTDIKGIPVPDLEAKLAYWLEPYFLPKKGPGIILIDDLTAAPKSVVASLLTLVQHRRVQKYKLPDDIMVIVAGNRVEDQSYCDQLSAAMRSRMVHINLVPNLDEWVDWGLKNDLHHSVIAFLKQHSGTKYFHTTTQEMSDTAFACPRTWHFASNIMKLELPYEIKREAIMGCVGIAAGNEFLLYQQIYEKLPTIEEILKNPMGAIVPKTPDALHAISMALAVQVKDEKNFLPVIKYTMRLTDEFRLITIQSAAKVNWDFILSGPKDANGKIQYGEYLKEFAQKYEKIAEHAAE